eukprot:Gb_23967 [translate_table: standard]
MSIRQYTKDSFDATMTPTTTDTDISPILEIPAKKPMGESHGNDCIPDLSILNVMDERNSLVSKDIYVSLLQACANANAFAEGKRVHAHMLTSRLEINSFLGTKLVNMYTMCGAVVDARDVFDKISERDVLLWNAMIRGYARNGFCEEGLTLYHRMQLAGIQPDKFTFPFVLKACAGLSALEQGKEIHAHIIRRGFDSDVFVGNALIDMYAKCCSIGYARQVFDKMSTRDVVTWNTAIGGYGRSEHAYEALKLFRHMQVAGWKPNSVTLVSILPACAHLAALQQGKEIHGHVIKSAFDSNISAGSALIDMYAKCGSMIDARLVFDRMLQRNVVSWNAIIAACAQKELSNEAIKLFVRMRLAGMKPDSVSFASVLSACAHLTDLQHGKEIHDYLIRNGFDSDIFVGSSLIDMYAKCGSVDIAFQLFDKMSQRNVVSWNAMIAGYTQNGHISEALKIFRQMHLKGIKPDAVTLTTILPACAHLAALRQGKEIHDYIIRSRFESDVFVGNALIDMYAKCGRIESGRQVFEKMCQRNVVSWNSMIAGHGMHGQGESALNLFHQMQETGMKPNDITFVALLSACSHAGLVDEGCKFFDCMIQDYCTAPTLQHYACIVDLLGRAGYLDEAHDFIQKMPLEPDAGIWGALLGACRIHCNTSLAEHVSRHLLELEPENPGYYVLLSNIYAAAGRWDSVAKVRSRMKDMGVEKKPGCSWIEVKNTVHAFRVGDRSHPQSEEMYAILKCLAGQMKDAGYVPDTNYVLHEVEEMDKEHILCGHSEKLAIAFGLINTCTGTPIQITKNLRVCGDCHTATKFISKIVQREIIVRDVNRFHHFKDGLCSFEELLKSSYKRAINGHYTPSPFCKYSSYLMTILVNHYLYNGEKLGCIPKDEGPNTSSGEEKDLCPFVK